MKPIPGIIWLVCSIALAGCASVLDEDGALAVAPYAIHEYGRIVVDARVNSEGPYGFALDTGATISVVFDALSRELALQPMPGKSLRIHGLAASGTFPLVSVNQIQVGREAWKNPRIALLPGETEASAGIDGILGIDFLRRYAVGFFTEERVVRLYPPDLVASRMYRGWSAVHLEPYFLGESGAALYLFEITIGGQSIPAIFDLGSGLNLFNRAAIRRIGLKTVRSRGKDVVSGAIDSAPLTARFRIREVATGSIRWRNEEFRVADLELFTTLLRGDVPYALIGAGLFTQRDFIIDFARNRLLVRVAMDEVDLIDADSRQSEEGL